MLLLTHKVCCSLFFKYSATLIAEVTAPSCNPLPVYAQA
jgi:hypothetical protein